VSIEPQVFDVLEFLVRTSPNLITKNQLIANVWDGRTVSDSTISNRISAARAAVRDNGTEQRLIQTFSRRGFRFVGSVRIQQEATPLSVESVGQQLKSALSTRFNKSSIAVLPFANIPEDDRKHQEFVVELSMISGPNCRNSAGFQSWLVACPVPTRAGRSI
jgi:DNA-binding winged helix-turn-helix (wHTH) protein